MNTKDKILSEALDLFSRRGYSDVSVADIASAVGIKAPSLYKHYKGKQAIFEACVERFSGRMTEVRKSLMMPGTEGSEADYQTADLSTITDLAVGMFMFYLRDDVASRFRRMLQIERYRNPEINRVYEDLFLNEAVAYEEQIFAELIKSGVIRQEEPHLVAIRFYSPIYYLLQKYDVHPELDECAREELTAMIQEFCRTYRHQ